MQLGRRHRLVLGFGMVVAAITVAGVSSYGDGDPDPSPSQDVLGLRDAQVDPPDPRGGSLAATVSWPSDAADLDRSDICVVLIDDAGAVYGENASELEPIPGSPVAARWTVDDLAEGRYTVYAAQCLTPAPDRRVWVEPQFLGGADQVEAASWVEIDDGSVVDVGTISLHRAGLETWPEAS